MQIATQEITGDVVNYPLGNAEEKPGWTIREVATIPPGPGRLKWNGTALERVPVLPPIIDELPLWRVKAVVELMGLKTSVEAAIDGMEEPTRTVVRNSWIDGNVMARSSATVNAVGAALGLSDAQLDDMWRQAAAFQV